MEAFPCLETEGFWAFVADNSALGVHRAGYNGIASLIPKHSGNNLFVPLFAGLNYETIHLAGQPPSGYRDLTGFPFEPRREPMHLERADRTTATLVQPETSYSHVSARITFTVEPPHYLHQRIELTFHRRFCPPDQPNEFRSVWASYIHMPPDRHVYLKLKPEGGALEGWVGVTRAEHRAPEAIIHPLPDGEIGPAEHLQTITQPLEPGGASAAGAQSQLVSSPLRSYYGFAHGSQLFLMMFKQPERFRFAYSPCGGGNEPAWSPAWDYVLHLDDAEVGVPYLWDLCLVVKEYRGRADILREVERYSPA